MTDLSVVTHKFLVYKDYLLNLDRQIEAFRNKTAEMKQALSQFHYYLGEVSENSVKAKAEQVYANEKAQLDEAEKILAQLISKFESVKDLSARTKGFVDELKTGSVGLSASIPFIPIMGVVAGTGAIVGFVNYLDNYFSPQGRIVREQAELIKKFTEGTITAEDYKTLSDDIYKTALAVESNMLMKYTGIDLPRSLFIGALVVGGYYILTQTSLLKKISEKILR